MLKEWQKHLLIPAGKKDQRQKSRYLAQTLSKCAIKEWVMLILFIRGLQFIICIENQVLDFISCIFFDLIDLVCANSYIVYSMMHPNDLTLLDFETIFSTYLITRYKSQSTATPDGKRGSKRKDQYHFEQGNLPSHLPEIQSIQRRFEYCYKERNDLKTYVLWLILAT